MCQVLTWFTWFTVTPFPDLQHAVWAGVVALVAASERFQ